MRKRIKGVFVANAQLHIRPTLQKKQYCFFVRIFGKETRIDESEEAFYEEAGFKVDVR